MPLPQTHSKLLKYWRGFTLAELLISLAILGVIATFTIPKIISAQQDQRYNALAKEAASTIAAAYQLYRYQNTVDANFTLNNLTPYLNYLNVDYSTSIDRFYSHGLVSKTCFPCYRLQNGSMLNYDVVSFAGTNTSNGVYFLIDPDGMVTDGTTNGPGKSVQFWLFYDGRLGTRATLPANATNSGGVTSAAPGTDPPWFSW